MAANSICPATGRTQILGFSPGTSPLSDHIVCTAPFAPGAAGDDITRVLGSCCNSTVQVVSDDTSETSSKCIYYCNATLYDGQDPQSGDTFWKAQQCTWTSSPDGPNGSWNPYQIRCYPKGWGGLAVDSGAGLAGSVPPRAPNLGLGIFVALVLGIVFL